MAMSRGVTYLRASAPSPRRREPAPRRRRRGVASPLRCRRRRGVASPLRRRRRGVAASRLSTDYPRRRRGVAATRLRSVRPRRADGRLGLFLRPPSVGDAAKDATARTRRERSKSISSSLSTKRFFFFETIWRTMAAIARRRGRVLRGRPRDAGPRRRGDDAQRQPSSPKGQPSPLGPRLGARARRASPRVSARYSVWGSAGRTLRTGQRQTKPRRLAGRLAVLTKQQFGVTTLCCELGEPLCGSATSDSRR